MILKLRRAINLTALLLALVLGAGCSLLPPEEPTFPVTVNLASDREIGQSFLARRDGLNGIRLFVTPIDRLPESMIVSLYDSPQAEEPLWQGAVDIPAGLTPGWFTLPLETQRSSAGKYYFVAVETESEQRVRLSIAPVNYYPEGSLYRDRVPENRHLEYRLRYSSFWAAAGLLGDTGPAFGLMAAFSILFTLPGWALFSAFWVNWGRQPLHNRWILASGLGLSVYPILLLWARLVRLEILPWLVWLVPLGAVGSFAWRFRKGDWRPSRPDFRADLPALLFFGVLALVLVTRLVPLRTLDAGMWGDSYHHTLITQLLIDNGGLFSSWEPYAPLITFTYHFGFHTAAALLSLLTGAPAHETVLRTGQLVNFLAVASLVPLGDALLTRFGSESISRKQRLYTGSVVLLTAGLLASIPMFNINWGRYTQIAGQAILVIWMAFSLDYFHSDRHSWKTDLVGWLLLAGLGLTHYRVLIFAVLWVPAYWLFGLRRAGVWQVFIRTFRSGYGAVLLILPWFLILFGGGLLAILQYQLSTPPEAVDAALENYNRVGDLTDYLPVYVWGAVAAIAVWAAARRAREALVLLVWALLLVLLANPAWLGLPGTGVVNNFAVVLAVYIPAALLVGIGVSWLAELVSVQLPSGSRRTAARTALVALALAAAAGSVSQVRLVNPTAHALVTRSDLFAYEWIRENLPADAGFFVNFYASEGGNTVSGSDGGWWLPYFTGRESVLPPFIMISEVTKPRDLRLELLELDARIQENTLDRRGIIHTLREMGVTHLYFGQKQGSVGSQGVFNDPFPLLESDLYSLVYQRDHVWIFEILPEPAD